MAILKFKARVQDEVDLNIKFVASMIGRDVRDLVDALREAHSEVQQRVEVIHRRGGAGEVLDISFTDA